MKLIKIKGFGDTIVCAELCPCLDLIAVVLPHTIQLYRTRDRTLSTPVFSKEDSSVTYTSLAWLPTGRLIAAGTKEGSIVIVSADSGDVISCFLPATTVPNANSATSSADEASTKDAIVSSVRGAIMALHWIQVPASELLGRIPELAKRVLPMEDYGSQQTGGGRAQTLCGHYVKDWSCGRHFVLAAVDSAGAATGFFYSDQVFHVPNAFNTIPKRISSLVHVFDPATGILRLTALVAPSTALRETSPLSGNSPTTRNAPSPPLASSPLEEVVVSANLSACLPAIQNPVASIEMIIVQHLALAGESMRSALKAWQGADVMKHLFSNMPVSKLEGLRSTITSHAFVPKGSRIAILSEPSFSSETTSLFEAGIISGLLDSMNAAFNTARAVVMSRALTALDAALHLSNMIDVRSETVLVSSSANDDDGEMESSLVSCVTELQHEASEFLRHIAVERNAYLAVLRWAFQTTPLAGEAQKKHKSSSLVMPLGSSEMRLVFDVLNRLVMDTSLVNLPPRVAAEESVALFRLMKPGVRVHALCAAGVGSNTNTSGGHSPPMHRDPLSRGTHCSLAQLQDHPAVVAHVMDGSSVSWRKLCRGGDDDDDEGQLEGTHDGFDLPSDARILRQVSFSQPLSSSLVYSTNCQNAEVDPDAAPSSTGSSTQRASFMFSCVSEELDGACAKCDISDVVAVNNTADRAGAPPQVSINLNKRSAAIVTCGNRLALIDLLEEEEDEE